MWFHAMCLSVHLVNVLLLFGLLRAALPSRPAALSAALFAIHPVQIESVAYLSALPDLVSTTMILFGLWALERRYFVLACLTCGLAVWAKEMAGVVVLLLPLWSLYRGQKWPMPMRAIWSFGIVLCGWFLMTRFAIHPELSPQVGVGLAQLGSLLSLVVWPFGRLTVDHDWRWITSDVVAWSVVGLFAALVFTPKRWASPVTFALLWVLCAVLPRFLVPLSEGMHEHHLYLPMVGLTMAFGSWMSSSLAGLDTGSGYFPRQAHDGGPRCLGNRTSIRAAESRGTA
jgi:hypothetical protein